MNLKNSPRRWTDIKKFVEYHRNEDEIITIYYYSILLPPPSCKNQTIYHEALKATGVKVEAGTVGKKSVKCKYCGKEYFRNSEKMVDVKMAVQMLDDAHHDRCDRFILVTGDSDLVPVIEKIRKEFPEKEVIVYIPTLSKKDKRWNIALNSVASKCELLPSADSLWDRVRLPIMIKTSDDKVACIPKSWIPEDERLDLSCKIPHDLGDKPYIKLQVPVPEK